MGSGEGSWGDRPFPSLRTEHLHLKFDAVCSDKDRPTRPFAFGTFRVVQGDFVFPTQLSIQNRDGRTLQNLSHATWHLNLVLKT